MTMWTLDDRYETMPWDELDAVVFDVGNVLLSYSPEEELEAFFPGETELHEKLMEKIIKTPYWNMMDRGTLTVQQAIMVYCLTLNFSYNALSFSFFDITQYFLQERILFCMILRLRRVALAI